jgi:Bacterial SH3 domain
MKTYLIAAAALLAMAAAFPAMAGCYVNDNSGTPLNLRASPNGRIIGTLRNGVELQLLDQTTLGGHVWVNVGRPDSIGWVAREMLDCKRTETYNYSCKANGKTYPLQVDETKMSLTWRGKQYGLNVTDVCGKYGWHAEGNGTSFDFCTATKGVASMTDKDGNELADCQMREPR